MASDATGTPTALGIPKLDVSNDAPSGLGFNAAMDEIDTLIAARIELPSSPSDGDGLVYDAGLGKWVAGTAGSASPTPIQLLNPASANAYWTVGGLTGGTFVAGHWGFVKDTEGVIYGQVLVPSGVTDVTIRAALGADATSGVTRMSLYASPVSEGSAMNFSTWAFNPASSVDTAVPSTAFLRKDATWSLTGLTGGDLLALAFQHNGTHANDTLAADTLLFGGWLEPA